MRHLNNEPPSRERDPMHRATLILATLMIGVAASAGHAQQPTKDLRFQREANPPMKFIHRAAPEPEVNPEDFETRSGFKLIDSLEEFRAAIKKDGQRIRMKPGVYRAEQVDPPIPEKDQQHLFAVTGSNNYFDLRGVVIETPVSVQSKLTNKAHVADTWHINGQNNTFYGGYFKNIIDRDYPDYNVTENEFEVIGDGNTFKDCTFVIRGSIPFGYSDFYGKGGKRWTRLDKHSFMSIAARNTRLIGCEVYQQSFGHGVHFHGAKGALIKDCYLTGTVRPTNDIFDEKAGPAVKHDFNIMYRGKRPIPRDQVIPLTEDGIRTYGGDKNIRVINTTVERFRGIQVHCESDVQFVNVTAREMGYFGFDVTAGKHGRTIVRNCRGDIAYSPLFNLTRAGMPRDSVYEMTVLPPREGVTVTDGTNLGRPTDFGKICGKNTTFIFRKGGDRPLPEKVQRVRLGHGKPLVNSKVLNYTNATLKLTDKVRNCTIRSVGPVKGSGKNNDISRLN